MIRSQKPAADAFASSDKPASSGHPARGRTAIPALVGWGFLGLLSSIAAASLGALTGVYAGSLSDASPVKVLAGGTAAGIILAALIPGLVLLRRDGRMRIVGIGMCAGGALCLGTLATVSLATHYDPFAMSPGEIDRALHRPVGAHVPTYYLGREADGKGLASVSHQDGVTFVEYGRCMDNDEGGCNRPLLVTSQPTTSYGSRGESPDMCRRLAPVLGVPAADLDGELTIFTGSSIVAVTYWKNIPNGYAPDRRRERAVASLLRPVDSPSAAMNLPAPDPVTQSFVDRHCSKPAR